MKTIDNPLILKTKMKSGHSGASSRYDSMKESPMSTPSF